MTNKEIRNTMNCLSLMCKDLNDAHNNYDVSTDEENAIRYELLDSIELFNDSQTAWKCTLNKCSKGWCLHYE